MARRVHQKRAPPLRADRARATLFAQQNIGLHFSCPRQRHDPSVQNAFEIRQIARDNPQAIVVEPEDMIDSLYFGNCTDGAFKVFETYPALCGQLPPLLKAHGTAGGAS